MSKKNWTSSGIVDKHSQDVIKWKLEDGLGRIKLARKLSELTGRHCTPGVMQIALQKLGLNEYKKSAPALVDIEDKTDEEEEIPIEHLIESRINASKKKKKNSQ